MHLPLHFDDSKCKCGALLDAYGYHRSACSKTGLLTTRRASAEVCAARICREGGARVRENQLVRNLNVTVPADDTRKIEVIASGLPFRGGKQIAIDTTVVSALTGQGAARGRSEGHALKEARKVKERRYHELVESQRCRLLVMGFEVAGRWSEDTVSF